MTHYWLIAKEVVGFIGAFAMALPWIRDYGRRHGWWQMKTVRVEGTLSEVRDKIVAFDEVWLGRAKPFDLYCMLIGLALVAASFFIGILLAV